MFMNTIAVGPREEVESCITGGTTVAIVRLREWVADGWEASKHDVDAASLERRAVEACLDSWRKGTCIDIDMIS